jgi:hypothetical protein
MKLNSIGQDLQDYQDFFLMVKLYLVYLVDPVKKDNCDAIKFHLRSNRLGRRCRWIPDLY